MKRRAPLPEKAQRLADRFHRAERIARIACAVANACGVGVKELNEQIAAERATARRLMLGSD